VHAVLPNPVLGISLPARRASKGVNPGRRPKSRSGSARAAPAPEVVEASVRKL
jgi:hypothetical protein